MKVKLCGGSNDGRVVNVLHGTSVVVEKRVASNSFDVNGEVIRHPRSFETYTRPADPIATGQVEHWTLNGKP